MFFGQFDCAPATFHRCADRDDARHTGFVCATNYVIEIVREIGIIEMGVRFDEHRLIVGGFCETPTSGSASDTDALRLLPFYNRARPG